MKIDTLILSGASTRGVVFFGCLDYLIENNLIDKDFKNTLKTWEDIRDKALISNAPSLVYEEGDIIKRALRDIYDNDTKYVHVEGNDGYQKAKQFMRQFMPRNSKFVKKS